MRRHWPRAWSPPPRRHRCPAIAHGSVATRFRRRRDRASAPRDKHVRPLPNHESRGKPTPVATATRGGLPDRAHRHAAAPLGARLARSRPATLQAQSPATRMPGRLVARVAHTRATCAPRLKAHRSARSTNGSIRSSPPAAARRPPVHYCAARFPRGQAHRRRVPRGRDAHHCPQPALAMRCGTPLQNVRRLHKGRRATAAWPLARPVLEHAAQRHRNLARARSTTADTQDP